MRVEQDHYKLLGIVPSADMKQINEAYRKLAFQFHPDRNQNNPEANKKNAGDKRGLHHSFWRYKTEGVWHTAGVSCHSAEIQGRSKVIINSHSSSPYRDHTGIVDQEPVKDTFRFWYIVRFESKTFFDNKPFRGRRT